MIFRLAKTMRNDLTKTLVFLDLLPNSFVLEDGATCLPRNPVAFGIGPQIQSGNQELSVKTQASLGTELGVPPSHPSPPRARMACMMILRNHANPDYSGYNGCTHIFGHRNGAYDCLYWDVGNVCFVFCFFRGGRAHVNRSPFYTCAPCDDAKVRVALTP